MSAELHPSLRVLPDVLLQVLGRHGRLDTLASRLEGLPHLSPPLRQVAPQGQPYNVNAVLGLDLQLQCTTPQAAEPERQWGLHSLTLYAGDWADPWPEGLEPGSTTAQDVVKLFAPEPEACLITPTMVCFTTPGWSEGQEWSVLCLFDASSHKLQSFSLIRVGEWLAEQDSRASVAAT